MSRVVLCFCNFVFSFLEVLYQVLQVVQREYQQVKEVLLAWGYCDRFHVLLGLVYCHLHQKMLNVTDFPGALTQRESKNV